MPGLLFLCIQVTQSEVRQGGGGELLPTSFKNALLPLQFSFDKFEVGNMFNGNMSHHEQELTQFKGIALVVADVATLRTFLRTLRFWLRGRILTLVHSVRIIGAGVWRFGNGRVLLLEGPLGEVPYDSVTELVGFLCQGVDGIDRLFSHPEPIC